MWNIAGCIKLRSTAIAAVLVSGHLLASSSALAAGTDAWRLTAGIRSAVTTVAGDEPAGWVRAREYDDKPSACKEQGGQWMMRPSGNRCFIPRKN